MMKYARAGDAYSFECEFFKISIVGDIEKIDFRTLVSSKDIVDNAFNELNRLKEIRAENEKSSGIKSLGEMVINVSINTDEISDAIDKLNKETNIGAS